MTSAERHGRLSRLAQWFRAHPELVAAPAVAEGLQALDVEVDSMPLEPDVTELRWAAKEMGPALTAYEVAVARASVPELREAKEQLISVARRVVLGESVAQTQENTWEADQAAEYAEAKAEEHDERGTFFELGEEIP